ncbi:Na/Pi cotransporter family protein [Ruegeria profundi]|uniref:Na/Pi cotransporter family protein n=1 Tax=Ruegeria profundi TaxID=1685378 RepID=UPI001CD1CE1B|nr:Na/Pi symporter [Ruegeria profundi]MCA0930113.1 Na/Pi symporter [Ruegeria profundi]
MLWSFLSALGGVGIFLFGMFLLTEGLKGLAGKSMRSFLARFTRTPLSGAATGALTTAVIQSSSATTVAAVGFVASGLLTFPQALGIIFGANIGTTITGWMVALLGFKLDLGEVVLPFIFFGALLRLSRRQNVALTGQALAGFSLIFVGIDLMKDGMAAFEGVVTPSVFPPDTMLGRLQLVAIGFAITVVTQSSSAGVAAALAALGAGAISFPQAAALVIGMDVGTTLTALLASVGGGTMARRTGLAHVIYNFMTGVLAFFILGPFATWVTAWTVDGNGQIALVAFHTFFNALGVLLVLPVARPFARLIEWLVPERGTTLSNELDPSLFAEPTLAVEAATHTLFKLNTAVCDHLNQSMGMLTHWPSRPPDHEELEEALLDLQSYLDKMPPLAGNQELGPIVASVLHALDHLFRLLYRCGQFDRTSALGASHRLRRCRSILAGATSKQARPNSPDDFPVLQDLFNRLRTLFREQRKVLRVHLFEAAINGKISDEDAITQVDAMRWLHRVAYHLWRIRVHLNAIEAGTTSLSMHKEARIEIEDD